MDLHQNVYLLIKRLFLTRDVSAIFTSIYIQITRYFRFIKTPINTFTGFRHLMRIFEKVQLFSPNIVQFWNTLDNLTQKH